MIYNTLKTKTTIPTIPTRKYIIAFCFFVIFIVSMRFWVGAAERAGYVLSAINSVLLLLLLLQKITIKYNRINIIPLLCLISGYFFTRSVIGVNSINYVISAYFILTLDESDRIIVFRLITKYFSILMLFSIVTFIIIKITNIPSLGLINYLSIDSDTSYFYSFHKNYIFCTIPLNESIRFNGPFHEPGHLGMMSAFLIFANDYSFRKKKELWLLLVSLLMTLSLAGYVLFIVGYLLLLIEKKKMKVGSFLSVCVFLGVCGLIYYIGLSYNEGNNLFNEYILNRLQYDEEKGIVGNNRAHNLIPIYYEMMWKDFETMLFGYDDKTLKWLIENGSTGTGFVMNMVRVGVVGTLFCFLFYLSYFAISKYKRLSFTFLVFVFLIYWQRSYAFWLSWVICYAYGILNIAYNRNLKNI